jgi:zinc transporter 5/7
MLLALPYAAITLLQPLTKTTTSEADLEFLEMTGLEDPVAVDESPLVAEAAATAALALLAIEAYRTWIARRPDVPSEKPKQASPGLNGRDITLKIASSFLPLHAAYLLGGRRVILLLLIVHSVGIVPLLQSSSTNPNSPSAFSSILAKHKTTLLFLSLLAISDFSGISSSLSLPDLFQGYIGLFLTAFWVHPQWMQSPKSFAQTNGHIHPLGNGTAPNAQQSNSDQTNVVVGGALAVFAVIAAAATGGQLFTVSPLLAVAVSGLACAASAVLSGTGSKTASWNQTSLLSGLGVTFVLTLLASDFELRPIVIQLVFSALAYLAIRADSGMGMLADHAHTHDPSHTHTHKTEAKEKPPSAPTVWLLQACERWPFIHSILKDRDSRRIAYFMRYVLPPKG